MHSELYRENNFPEITVGRFFLTFSKFPAREMTIFPKTAWQAVRSFA